MASAAVQARAVQSGVHERLPSGRFARYVSCQASIAAETGRQRKCLPVPAHNLPSLLACRLLRLQEWHGAPQSERRRASSSDGVSSRCLEGIGLIGLSDATDDGAPDDSDDIAAY